MNPQVHSFIKQVVFDMTPNATDEYIRSELCRVLGLSSELTTLEKAELAYFELKVQHPDADMHADWMKFCRNGGGERTNTSAGVGRTSFKHIQITDPALISYAHQLGISV